MRRRFDRTVFVCFAATWLSACNSSDSTSGIANAQGGGSFTSIPATPGDWSRFRGPDGSGASAEGDPPIEWSADENIAWKTPLPGPGASSPIVWGDRVYLTCYTGYYLPEDPGGGTLEELERHLLAIRLSDGKIIWDKAIAARLPEEPQIRDHGYAANSAVADEAGVIVFFGKSGVYAFDHDGNERWHADVGDGASDWGTAASPVLWENLVFINASVESQTLYALDRKTGDEVWSAGEINDAWNTPLVLTTPSGREELVVARQGTILAFDPASGDELWNCATDITWYMVPSPVVDAEHVYYLGGRSGIMALGIRTGGSGDVTDTHRLWTSNQGSNVSSPVLHEGHLYWMNDSQGLAYCAVAETGEILYEQRMERSDQVYASALLANGRVYYLDRSGRTFVVAATPEFEQLAINDLRDGSIFNGSPAVAGDQLLIRSDKFLYCIGE
jgi:outer membrane protein assembly factor BamB